MEAIRTTSVKENRENRKPDVILHAWRNCRDGCHKQDLKDPGILFLTTSSFNLSIWPVQKTAGSWKMTVDYHKLNQVVTPIAAVLADVASLLEQINTSPGTAMRLLTISPPPSLLIKTTRSSCFQLARTGNISSMSYLSSTSAFQPCNLVYRDLNYLFLPQDVTLVNYIDDIMPIGPSEQELATTLDLLIRHLCVRVGK